MLARHLGDKVCPDDGYSVCYFFFKDDFADQKTAKSALCCIMHQAFVQRPDLISDDVLKRFDRDGERLFTTFETLWELLTEIASKPPGSSQGGLLYVLNAVHECSNRIVLLKALSRLYATTTKTSWLKFLVTSRPYLAIRTELHTLERAQPTIHLSGESEEEVDKISHEIAIVVKQRIDQIAQRFQLSGLLRKELSVKMSTFPNRTYLWAYLAFADIEHGNYLSAEDLRRRIERISPTIEEAYDKILSRSEDSEQVRRILHLVLAAERPLILQEMATGLAFGSGSYRNLTELERDTLTSDQFRVSMREACGLFLIIVDERVYLMHQTAREFLIQTRNVAVGSTALPQHCSISN